MWPNPQESADLITFTEKSVSGKLHFFAVFAFYISDRKQYTSINGFNSNLTNIYGEPKVQFQDYR